MQSLLLYGSKKASAPHNRHSLRSLVQANSMCSPQRASQINNVGISAWGLHIESSCLISSTGSWQVQCVFLDVATILCIVTPHDREAPEAWPYARHERNILTREDKKDQNGLVLAYDGDTVSDPGAYFFLCSAFTAVRRAALCLRIMPSYAHRRCPKMLEQPVFARRYIA